MPVELKFIVSRPLKPQQWMLISMGMDKEAATATPNHPTWPSFMLIELPRTFWMLEPALSAHKHNALGPQVLTYLHPRGLWNASFNCDRYRRRNLTSVDAPVIAVVTVTAQEEPCILLNSIQSLNSIGILFFPSKIYSSMLQALLYPSGLLGRSYRRQNSTVAACGWTRVQIASKASMIEDRIWIEAWDWNGPAAAAACAFNLA